MVVRKLSVFLLVVAFHVVVLGVVYLATRTEEPINTDQEVKPEKEVVENPQVKTQSDKSTNNDTTPKKVDPPKLDKPKYDYVFYTVEKGDFLSKIAEKHKISTQEIMKANNLKDANKIFLGQKLKIPVKK